MSCPVIGLTGNIACGKSAVSGFLLKWGIPVVDADQIARDVVAPGTEGLLQITEAFGDGILDASGQLDRPALGAVIFGDPKQRATLNAILHPKIAQRSAERILELQSTNPPYIVYDAALLVENQSYRQFAALIVVTADPEEQRKRLLARDGLTESDAQKRIDAQLSQAAKAAVADYVIDNSADYAQLERRVREVHGALLRIGEDAS
jgi:dephospho-CoA kinase